MTTRHDIEALPALTPFDQPTRQAIAARARLVTLAPGDHVFDPGHGAEAFLLVVAGSVRVYLTAESGREIVLYRVSTGESCVLTTSNLFDTEAYAATAICETPVTALALPRMAFRSLLADSASFRDTILAAYAARVSDLILTLEESRTKRIDARLAGLLSERAGAPINATHQALAVELGTAREVISRTLKRFEREGLIALARGEIIVKQRGRLADISDAL